MRPKSLILLSLALGCGLVATLGINQVMSKGSPVAAPEGEKMEIFVAVQDIGMNDQVTADHIKLEEWPKDKVPMDALGDLEAIIGRRAKMPILPGEPLRDGKLMIEGEYTRATDHVTPGCRLVAMKVNAESTGGYIIKPGDRVDLMVYLRKDPTLGIDKTIGKTFLQNIKVFAVGGVITEEEGDSTKNYQHLTVEVTPDQADKFKLASYMGQIDLSVRGSADDTIIDAPVTDAEDFVNNLMGRGSSQGSPANTTSDEPKEEPTTESPSIPGIEALAADLSKEFQPQVEEPWSMQIVEGSSVREFNVQKGSWVAVPKGGSSFGLPGASDPTGFLPEVDEDSMSPSSDEEGFDLNSILDE
jgi:pilus assembly protein CpaB